MPRSKKKTSAANNKKAAQAPKKTVTTVVSRQVVSTPAKYAVNSAKLPKPFISITPTSKGSLNSVRVQGLDMIGAIACQNAFTQNVVQPINPLNGALFPKLAAMAALFEKWRPGPNGLRFGYTAQCPTSQVGNLGMFVDTDPDDQATPAGMVQILEEQFSLATPVYDSNSFSVPRSQDSNVWYYTQSAQGSGSGGNPEADRTAFSGIFYVYSQGGGSSTPPFVGYVYVSYDIEMCSFRNPTSVGFELVNHNSVPSLTSGVASTFNLSDGTFYDYLTSGARGARYLYDTAVMEYLTGTGVQSHSDRALLMPPVGAVTNGQLGISVSSATSDDEKSVPPKGMVLSDCQKTVLVESFQPWRCIQKKDGSWWYKMGPNEPLQDLKKLKIIGRPMAAGDVTLQAVAYDQTGAGTVIASITLNNTAAFVPFLAWALTPSAPTLVGFTINAVFTTARAISYIYSLVGPSTEGGGV